eukprot:Filipodium_phascolosomae@DN2116_c0_g1_i1.p1
MLVYACPRLQVFINGGGKDVYRAFRYYYNRMDMLQPLFLTGTAGIYDVHVTLRGGGEGGKSGAGRLAIGRALVDACPACTPLLIDDDVLYHEKRDRLPKIFGHYTHRTNQHFCKR